MDTTLVNQQLQNALAKIIEKSINASDVAIEFLSSQIPDVISQLLMWKFAYHLSLALVGVLSFIAIFAIPCVVYKLCKKHGSGSGDDDSLFCGFMSLIASGLIGAIVTGNTFNLVWLQIWIAPKIYLIEYAATLVKGG